MCFTNSRKSRIMSGITILALPHTLTAEGFTIWGQALDEMLLQPVLYSLRILSIPMHS